MQFSEVHVHISFTIINNATSVKIQINISYLLKPLINLCFKFSKRKIVFLIFLETNLSKERHQQDICNDETGHQQDSKTCDIQKALSWRKIR